MRLKPYSYWTDRNVPACPCPPTRPGFTQCLEWWSATFSRQTGKFNKLRSVPVVARSHEVIHTHTPEIRRRCNKSTTQFGDLGVLRRARAPSDTSCSVRKLRGEADQFQSTASFVKIDVDSTQRSSRTPAFLHQTRIQKSRILFDLDPTQVLPG